MRYGGTTLLYVVAAATVVVVVFNLLAKFKYLNSVEKKQNKGDCGHESAEYF